MFHVKPEQVQIEQVGLNHLNWVRRITIGGDDATEAVLKQYIEHLKHDQDDIHFPPFLIELLTIQAATTGDQQAAMLALLNNPLGPDAAHVEAVWDDIKRTNAGMLPQF